MILCPLCEHPQAAGSECELCGKRLLGVPESVPFALVEGLEPTLQPEAAEVVLDPLPDLEPTGHPPSAAPDEPAPGELASELQPTRVEPVVVELETVPGLEPTLSESLTWEERTPLLVAPPCRYCRTPANPGDVLCGRCGMRLPLFQTMAAGAEEPPRRCPSCGSMSGGDLCRQCGGRMPASPGSPLVNRI